MTGGPWKRRKYGSRSRITPEESLSKRWVGYISSVYRAERKKEGEEGMRVDISCIILWGQVSCVQRVFIPEVDGTTGDTEDTDFVL